MVGFEREVMRCRGSRGEADVMQKEEADVLEQAVSPSKQGGQVGQEEQVRVIQVHCCGSVRKGYVYIRFGVCPPVTLSREETDSIP
jgi:hypothetical protein